MKPPSQAPHLIAGHALQPDASTPMTTNISHHAHTAQQRGDRLSPRKSSRTYCVLAALRNEIERAIQSALSDIQAGTLIDYGCGNMPYQPLFQAFIDHYVGCDFAGNSLAHCEIGADSRIPLSSEYADVVLSTQVLEHVEDPTSYLLEAHRVLKQDGVLLLSTHGVWKYHPDPLDLWRWTSSGLRSVVESAGFRVHSFRGVLGPAATGLQIFQDALVPQLYPLLQSPFSYCMQRVIWIADRWSSAETRDRDACVYFLVARRSE